MRQAFSHTAAQAEQSRLAENPYRVIEPIRKLRKELGLTSSDLVTLQALISFMPKREGQASRMSIVFPSNASLVERTNGLDERTMRRCIGRLIGAGLIQRRDSATRKRFPLRYGGVIRDAFGFDLQPMFDREPQLRAQAERLNEDRERLRSLRAEALALRVEALRQARDKEAVSFLESVRNVLRRVTIRASEIIEIIAKMAGMIGTETRFPDGNQEADEVMTDDMSAADGQNVRHVEPTRLTIKKEGRDRLTVKKPDPARMEWTDLRSLSEFFPDEPRDAASVSRLLDNVGRLLRIDQKRMMDLVRKNGPGRLLIGIDELIERMGAEHIRNPQAYLETMMGQGRGS